MTTVFITGANRGIGFELTKQYSEDPANLVIATTRSLDNAGQLKALNRENVKVVRVDQNEPLDKVKRDLQILDKFAPSGVDVVIQNAGSNDLPEEPDTSPATANIDFYSLNFEHNTVGSIRIYQAIYPYWIKKTAQEKKFVFVSSGLGWINNYYGVQAYGYGVSKAALNYFSKEAAFTHAQSEDETVRNSVTIAVHPGVVATELAKSWIKKNKYEGALSPEHCGELLKGVFDGLKSEDNGTFKSYTGEQVSW